MWSQLVLLGVKEFFGGTKSGFELGFGLSELIKGSKPSGGSPFSRKSIRKKTIPTHLKPKSFLEKSTREFLQKSLEPFYLRRDKSNHLELPPKVRQFHRFGDVLKKEHEQIQRFIDLEIDDLITPDHISKIAEMRIASALRLAKSKQFKEYTEEIIKSPCIVFAYHNEALETLVDHFNKFGVPVWTIMQGDSATQISLNTDQFQGCNEGVMIISIKKGSTGLTLTNAQRICFVELDWTMADLDQCESRVHRFGKNGNVLIDYFVTKGGIDDLLLNKLQEKETNNDILEETKK